MPPDPTTDPTPEARLLGEIEFAIGHHFNEVRNEGEIDEYGLMQSIREHLREMRALDLFAQAAVERDRARRLAAASAGSKTLARQHARGFTKWVQGDAVATVFVDPPHLEENIAGGYDPSLLRQPSADDMKQAQAIARFGMSSEATKQVAAALTAAHARGGATMRPVVEAARKVLAQYEPHEIVDAEAELRDALAVISTVSGQGD